MPTPQCIDDHHKATSRHRTADLRSSITEELATLHRQMSYLNG
jgi:hypothetical protein